MQLAFNVMRDLDVLRKGAKVVARPAEVRSTLCVDIDHCRGCQLSAVFQAVLAEFKDKMMPGFVRVEAHAESRGLFGKFLQREFVKFLDIKLDRGRSRLEFRLL